MLAWLSYLWKSRIFNEIKLGERFFPRAIRQLRFPLPNLGCQPIWVG